MMNDKTTKLVVQVRRHCAEEPPLGVLVLLLLQVGRGGPVAWAFCLPPSAAVKEPSRSTSQ